MFIDVRNLQERRADRDSQFEGTRDIRNGYLFEVNGSVEGDREGLIWFKALDGNSEPFQVFYNGVIGDLRANMFVKIERNPKDPARWQVSEFDTGIYFNDQSTYEQLPSLSAIPAKADYEWPPGFPGAKALNIFPRAITDFAVRPTSPASMKARVYSGIYPGATNYARFQGPVNTKDFTADVPGAGLARLAAISIDSTGTLNYTNGTTFVDGLPMPDASLPAVPASQMLISAIRLVNGMTAIEESNFDLEMRPLMANGTVNVKVSEVWESDFGAVALQSDAGGGIGVGTSTIPHGGIGAALLALEGANADAVNGPNLQATTALDDYPLFQMLNYAHDNISLIFDASFDGVNVVSSDAGSNFRLLKASDTFRFEGEWGIPQGNNVTFDELMTFWQAEAVFNEDSLDRDFRVEGATDINLIFGDAGNDRVGVGTALPLKLLHVGPGTDAPTVAADGLYVALDGNVSLTVRDNANNVELFGLAFTTKAFLGTATNHALTLRSNNTDALTIDTSQNITIESGYLGMVEVTAPAAGAANSVRIYAEDNGAGKTRLMAIFNTGAAQQVAIQP